MWLKDQFQTGLTTFRPPESSPDVEQRDGLPVPEEGQPPAQVGRLRTGQREPRR